MSPAAVVPLRKDPGAEWEASIPAQLDAREAMVFVQKALRDADDATKEIVARFHGTLPPPPWPKHQALLTAIDAMDGGRLMLEQAIKAGHTAKQPKSGPLGTRLLFAGKNLYREIAVMQKNMQGVKLEDLPRLAAAAAKRVASTQLGGWATAALLLWALHEFGGDE